MGLLESRVHPLRPEWFESVLTGPQYEEFQATVRSSLERPEPLLQN